MGKEIKNRTVYIYGLLFLVILLLRIPALYHTIIDIDEAAFAEFANKWIEGAIPYVGVYDNKPILAYFFYYVIFYLFGINNLFAVHVATIILVFIASVILYVFVLHIADVAKAKSVSIFFVFLMHTYEPKYIATNTETLFTIPILVSFILYYYYMVQKNEKLFNLIVSGIFAGIAFLINYKAGILLAVFSAFGLYLVARSDNKKMEFLRQMKAGVYIAIGFLIPLAIALKYFYSKGAVNEFITLGFLYNFKYIQSGMKTVPYLKAAGRFLLFVVCSLPLWVILVKQIYIHNKKNNDDTFVLLLIWLVGSIFAAMLGWRAYGHYFIQLVLPLSLISGLSVHHVTDSFIKRTYAFMTLLAIIFTLSRINIPVTYHYLGDSNALSHVTYKKVAQKVIAITSPKDTMFVWGSGASAYIYANRRCSSRIIITDYVSGRQFGVSNEAMGENVNQYIQYMRSEFISEFKKKPPAVFVDTSGTGYFGYDKFPLTRFTELYTIINTNYEFVEIIDGMSIYSIKK